MEYAHRRWWIKQYDEGAKQLLGWDQFQGRRYDAFHRHTIAVMLGYSFFVWVEWQQRQHVRRGPTRRRFPPRPDRRRRSLPRVRRAVADWLLQAALRTLIRELPPLRSYPLLL